MITNGNYQIQFWSVSSCEFLPRLGAEADSGVTQLLQQSKGEGVNMTFGVTARTEGAKPIRSRLIKYGFRDYTSRGVTCTKEQSVQQLARIGFVSIEDCHYIVVEGNRRCVQSFEYGVL